MYEHILRRILILSVSLMLSSCAVSRFYPICIQDTGDTPPELLWLRSKEDINNAILWGTGLDQDSYSLSSYGATIRADSDVHSQFATIWSSYACIISSGLTAIEISQHDILLRQCQADVSNFLKTKAKSWPGDMGDVRSECIRIEPAHGK
jgi:hypothetical protein